MLQYFAKDYTGGAFVLFGPGHLIALAVVVLFNIFIVWRFRGADEDTKHKVRLGITAALWLNELGWHIWKYSIGDWTIQEMLPFHLCSVLVWVGGAALITKNYKVYEFMYFMGLAGATQALLTPDAGIYGFPHYRPFQTIIAHGLIVASAIFMTFVEGYRPTWKSLGRVILWMNIYMAIVFVINQFIGSNYLFIAHKPATASLLDLLPPWPYYILYIELIGIVLSLLLYLPFWIKDLRTARAAS
jgi:hypothetical integral membrane protein (TIGR02206 family)